MSRYKTAETLANHLAYSPATIHLESFDMLNDALNNKYDLVDANNPFIQSSEMTATAVCGLMMRMDMAERRRYPRLAQTMTDLYPHMGDSDFKDIFATPIRGHTITVGLGAKQLRDFAIYDSSAGLYRVHIPRDTVWTASGYFFTAHQPIIITIWDNGEIQALFDDSVESPILVRESNIIDYRFAMYEGVEFFVMDIPCDQLNVASYKDTLSGARKWVADITYENNFFYARGYYTLNGVDWLEMHTVYDGNTYDPTDPTMVIEVGDGTLKAYIPDIFITEAMVGISARVDIYTTVGETSIDLSNLEMADWSAEWNDFSNLSGSFVVPLEYITSRLIYSTSSSIGGKGAKTFTAVKEDLLYADYGKRGAYTEKELQTSLTSSGYTFSLRKDSLFNRTYVASRSLDDALPLDATNLTTGIGVSNEIITIYTGQEDLTYGIVQNTQRCCLLPNLLFKESNGVMVPVTDTGYQALTSLSVDALVTELNAYNYGYSPFHTILDYSASIFTARSYWLSSPSILHRNVRKQSSSLGYTMLTNDITLKLIGNNYVLTVTADQPAGLDVTYLQLTTHDKEGNFVYLNAEGALSAQGTFTFTFNMGTSFDVTDEDALNIYMYNSVGELGEYQFNLEHSFNLVYVVPSSEAHGSGFDDKLYLAIYDESVSAITYETAKLLFGNRLKGLFLLPATQVKAPTYQAYATDVYKTYEETVWETDAYGIAIYYDDVTGLPYFNVLHNVGDPVLDDNGEPVILHSAGDHVLNASSQLPVKVTDVDYLREIRMPIFDARFLFSTVDTIVAYQKAIPSVVHSYLSGDIASLSSKMIERTDLFFEPLATQQSTAVKVSQDRTVNMRTALSFTVVFLCSPVAYDDYDFRENIEKAAKQKLLSSISDNYFTMKEINASLSTLGGDRIYNITVTDPTGGTGYAEITEGLSSFSFAKTMTVKANGETSIKDDITFTWTK